MTISYIVLLLMLLFQSCESKLYPPTDPPVLSNIVLTSDSYRDPTSVVREGDTVFVSVAVSDPEDDPETLALSVLSGGSVVKSDDISSSRIFNDSHWETWFESAGMATGAYTLNLTASDKEGNEGETVSKDFFIGSDNSGNVLPADIVINMPAGPDNWTLRNTTTGEPFLVDFTVTNNFSMTIDILMFTINIEDAGNTVRYSGTAVVPNIEPAPAANTAGQLRLNILDETNPNIVGGEAVADTSTLEIVIY